MLKINWDLLPLKGHYFFFDSGTSPLYPTMPVYAKQLGFSSVVVGTLYTIFPICAVIAKPIIGAFGDKFKAHKKLLIVCQVLIMLSYFAIQFVPSMPQANVPGVNLTCADTSQFQICPKGARQRGIAGNFLASNESLSCQLKCFHPTYLSIKSCGICTTQHHEKIAIQYLLEESDMKPEQRRHEHVSAVSDFGSNVTVEYASLVDSCMILSLQDVNFENGWIQNPRCAVSTNVYCIAHCSSAAVQSILHDAAANDADVPTYWQFWIFSILLFISYVSTSVSVSLTDTVCIEKLGKQSDKFGNQRLWGSIGWGIFSIISGLLVDVVSSGSDLKNYTPSFYLMLIPMLLDIFCLHSLRYEQTETTTHNIWKNVGKLFLNLRIVVFMIWCTFIGACFGLVWSFLFWYMEELAGIEGGDALTYIKTIEGLVGGIHCFFGEIPSYFFSGWVINKLGHGHTMSIVLLLAAVRFLLYSFISNPWWVLPVSVFQAMNGLFFPTMTSYAKIVAEPGTEATAQGLVSALCEGVGGALGSFVAGVFVDAYGGAMTFRIFGFAALIMTAFNAIAQYLLDGYSKEGDHWLWNWEFLSFNSERSKGHVGYMLMKNRIDLDYDETWTYHRI